MTFYDMGGGGSPDNDLIKKTRKFLRFCGLKMQFLREKLKFLFSIPLPYPPSHLRLDLITHINFVLLKGGQEGEGSLKSDIIIKGGSRNHDMV